MNVLQNLKARQYKKGNKTKYRGQIKFFANPNKPGFAGIKKTVSGDVITINEKAKQRDLLAHAKKEKEIEKLRKTFEKEMKMKELYK